MKPKAVHFAAAIATAAQKLIDDRYPNTERKSWNDVTPADATSAELNLVHQIMGQKPSHISDEQWRENMRSCAKAIREHVRESDLLAEALEEAHTMRRNFEEAGAYFAELTKNLAKDSSRLDWLEKHNARAQYVAEDEASVPHAVVYLPALEADEDENVAGFWREAARADSMRAAIDEAMVSGGAK